MHSKFEPTGTSSSWFATCLNEVSFSLQFLLVFLSNFPYHLTFHCFVSSNPVGNHLCKVMNWLEVIGLVFLQGWVERCVSIAKTFLSEGL